MRPQARIKPAAEAEGALSTIIVSSAIANKPGNGGNAWAVLSWLLGLRRLGLDYGARVLTQREE